jgi:hypothetical protein
MTHMKRRNVCGVLTSIFLAAVVIFSSCSNGSTDGNQLPLPPPVSAWTVVADSTLGTIYDLAYGNDRWLAGDEDGSAAYSTDNGVTWTEVGKSKTGFLNKKINAIAYGSSPSRWIAVGEDGYAAYTADGSGTWTPLTNLTTAVSGIDHLNAIATDNAGKWVASGSGGDTAFSNDNGATWTAVSNISSEGNTVEVLTYVNSQWVAMTSKGKMVTSSNGTTWSAPVIILSEGSGIRSAVYSTGRWVVAGEDGKAAYSNDNGATWTSIDLKFGTTDINSIAFNGSNCWIAIGGEGEGKTAWSADGITWTAFTEPKFTGIGGLRYANGRWFGIGADGKMIYADPK